MGGGGSTPVDSKVPVEQVKESPEAKVVPKVLPGDRISSNETTQIMQENQPKTEPIHSNDNITEAKDYKVSALPIDGKKYEEKERRKSKEMTAMLSPRLLTEAKVATTVPEEVPQELLTVHSWDINPFMKTTAQLESYFNDIFEEYQLFDQFNIDRKKLHNFFQDISKHYHDRPFHNFQHGWSVCHISYQLLRNGADKYLQPLDILSLLVSAICHDLDHPGHNNAFERACKSPLFLKHNDSVLEHHHYATMITLLGNPDNDILMGLDHAQKTYMLDLMHHAIMMTDLTFHFGLMDILKECAAQTPSFDIADEKKRRFLTGCLIHVADLSGQALNRSLALNWGQRVLEEFANQHKREKELGFESFAAMRDLEHEKKRWFVQMDFLKVFVKPLWTEMQKIFPASRELWLWRSLRFIRAEK